MKLKELKAILNNLPESADDYEVITDIDNKNGYSSPISSIKIGNYEEESIRHDEPYGVFLDDVDCTDEPINAIAFFIQSY